MALATPNADKYSVNTMNRLPKEGTMKTIVRVSDRTIQQEPLPKWLRRLTDDIGRGKSKAAR